MRVVVLGSYVHAHCLAVPTLPINGASIQATDCWRDHGGKGLNLAVGMHRLGLKVCLLLAVGRDQAGMAICQFLADEGLATTHVLQLGEHSGFGVGLVSETGQNIIAVYAGANHLLTQAHINALDEEIQQAKLVCAQFEVQQTVVLAAFQLAKTHQVRTLLNPSPWQQPSAALLKATDILVLNEVEALLMLGSEQVSLSVDEWLEIDFQAYWQGELLIVTLAERGSLLFKQAQRPLYVAAWQVKQADPTGAGDAFTAGFTHALSYNKPYPQAMQFANACGAILANQTGVLEALPPLGTVEAFMQQNHSPHLR